ncbi:MAG: RidA family protein [Chthoniobacterales bacterium]
MSYTQKAKNLGIEFTEAGEPGYLNLCIKTGNLLFTSGHVSDQKGIVGEGGVSVEAAYAAAKDCMVKILKSVHATNGTLDNLRVIKLLGCVYSKENFIEQHLVINGASDLIHEIFGKDGDGFHARSAVGFSALPTGVSVEIEAIFEIKS